MYTLFFNFKSNRLGFGLGGVRVATTTAINTERSGATRKGQKDEEWRRGLTGPQGGKEERGERGSGSAERGGVRNHLL